MIAAMDGFEGEADHFVDLTMLCLEYRGPGATGPDVSS